MKIKHALVALYGVLAVFAFIGCTNSHLAVKDSSEKLAPVLGAVSEEIEYINYAKFWLEEDDDSFYLPRNVGFIALTSSGLILGKGTPAEAGKDSLWSISFSELSGFARFDKDLQLISGDARIIVYPFSPNPRVSGKGRFDKLEAMLKEHSVPAIEPIEVVGVLHDTAASVGGRTGWTWGDSSGSGSDSFFYNANGTVNDSPLNRPLN